MRTSIYLLIVTMIFSGCMQLRQLAHLPRLMTLDEMSKNKDVQTAYVEYYDKNFEKLLTAIQDGTINQYQDQKSFYDEFDQPTYVNEKADKNGAATTWMYRYQLKKFDSEKVYLYFDKDGKLIKWKHVLPAKKG